MFKFEAGALLTCSTNRRFMGRYWFEIGKSEFVFFMVIAVHSVGGASIVGGCPWRHQASVTTFITAGYCAAETVPELAAAIQTLSNPIRSPMIHLKVEFLLSGIIPLAIICYLWLARTIPRHARCTADKGRSSILSISKPDERAQHSKLRTETRIVKENYLIKVNCVRGTVCYRPVLGPSGRSELDQNPIFLLRSLFSACTIGWRIRVHGQLCGMHRMVPASLLLQPG